MRDEAALTIDAVFVRHKVAQMQARAQHSTERGSTDRAKALSDVVRLIDKTPKKKDLTGVCGGCAWRGVRHQKCTCCARNANLKDCYTEV